MAMSLSLAVTAGAAFTDQDKIVNDEAVDMCVALNVINGRTDGSFDPAGNVTRAEMAKMICIVLNGGKEPTTATKAVPTFADIDGHWAEGYIEYCFAKGVVAGKSATEFAPNAGVTGTEAAKMLLVALGYNAEVEKMVGANWALYTNVLANQDGLYEDLEAMDPGAALSRDNAAQMIWNALQAKTIAVTSSIDRNDGSIIDSYSKTGDTLLKAKYGTSEETGIMTAFSYNSDKAEWTYTIACGEKEDCTYTTTEDFTALYQQDVKVIYKAKDVFGIFADDAVVIAEGVIGDIEDLDKIGAKTDEVTIDGVDYKLEKTTGFFFGAGQIADVRDIIGYGEDKAAMTGYEAFPFTAIDNDDDGKIDTIVVYPFTVEQVEFVGSKSVITDKATYTYENDSIYEGVAEDDFVIVTAAANSTTKVDELAKLDVATGTVSVKNVPDYTIGGEVYTVASGVDASKLALNKEVEFVAVNGYIFYADQVSATVSLKDIVFIDGAEVVTSYGSSKVMAQAYDIEGNMTEIEVKSVNDKAPEIKTAADLNGLWAFDLDEGKYELKDITADAKDVEGDFDIEETKDVSAGKDKIAGMRVNADAVVFVVEGDGDVVVKTGADIAKWGAQTEYVAAEGDKAASGSLTSVDAFANKTNGVAYVELAAIVMVKDATTPDAAADAVYGYVTAVLGQTEDEDGTAYNSYTVWTATGEQKITVKATNDNFKGAKGAFVVYENDKLSVAVEAKDATTLTGIAGDSLYFAENAQEYLVTADTQIIYIDVEAVAGAEGALRTATDLNGDKTVENNVIFVKGEADGSAYELTVIYVDINNDISDVFK